MPSPLFDADVIANWLEPGVDNCVSFPAAKVGALPAGAV